VKTLANFAIARKPAIGDINEKLIQLYECVTKPNPDLEEIAQKLQGLAVDTTDNDRKQLLVNLLLLAKAENVPLLPNSLWAMRIIECADLLATVAKEKLVISAHEYGSGVKQLRL